MDVVDESLASIDTARYMFGTLATQHPGPGRRQFRFGGAEELSRAVETQVPRSRTSTPIGVNSREDLRLAEGRLPDPGGYLDPRRALTTSP